VHFCRARFIPVEIASAWACLTDGLKMPKEGQKIPAVKELHRESTNDSKPEFIDGHSFQALALLVRTAGGFVTSVLPTARIHEGLIDRTRELQRTLLDRLVELFLEVARDLSWRGILMADAFYASAKVILHVLAQGHHLVTRVRCNAVAHRPAPVPRRRRRGGPAATAASSVSSGYSSARTASPPLRAPSTIGRTSGSPTAARTRSGAPSGAGCAWSSSATGAAAS
jgi:hypothetical protein